MNSRSVHFIIKGGIVTSHAKNSIYATKFARALKTISLLDDDNRLCAKFIRNNLTYQ